MTRALRRAGAGLAGGLLWHAIARKRAGPCSGGAGDCEEEADGLGLPYPPLATRFEIVEETVRACLEMWQGERGSERPFAGEHLRLGRALNAPQSLARPHPRILIAGGGERRTLPLVARYADACNIPPTPELPRKLDVLRRLCDEAGRDYDAIEKTAPFGFDVGPDGSRASEVVEQLRRLGDAGIETVLGWLVGVDERRAVDVMARDVIPPPARSGPAPRRTRADGARAGTVGRRSARGFGSARRTGQPRSMANRISTRTGGTSIVSGKESR